MQSQHPQSGTGGAEAVAEAPGQSIVTITVNNLPVQIHRGNQSVAAIKTAGHVPLADDLEQIIDGQMHPLPDDGHVVIRGHEVFVSHPKSTSSS
jgi:hypothetical protein